MIGQAKWLVLEAKGGKSRARVRSKGKVGNSDGTSCDENVLCT